MKTKKVSIPKSKKKHYTSSMIALHATKPRKARIVTTKAKKKKTYKIPKTPKVSGYKWGG